MPHLLAGANYFLPAASILGFLVATMTPDESTQRRQLNVRIPDKILSAIKMDAVTENVSVESLCTAIFSAYLRRGKTGREEVASKARKRAARTAVSRIS